EEQTPDAECVEQVVRIQPTRAEGKRHHGSGLLTGWGSTASGCRGVASILLPHKATNARYTPLVPRRPTGCGCGHAHVKPRAAGVRGRRIPAAGDGPAGRTGREDELAVGRRRAGTGATAHGPGPDPEVTGPGPGGGSDRSRDR